MYFLWPQHKTCTFRLLCTKDLDCYIRSHGFLTLAKKKLVVPWEHLLVAKNFSLVGGKEQKNEDDPIVSGQWHIGLGLQPNLKSQKFFLMSDWKFQILQFLPFPRNTKSLHIWSQKKGQRKDVGKAGLHAILEIDQTLLISKDTYRVSKQVLA